MTRFAAPLAELQTPVGITDLLAPGAATPLSSSETVRARGAGSFCAPEGSSRRAAANPRRSIWSRRTRRGGFPRINAAVDACNVASLFSGLPISLVDLDRVVGELRIAVCAPGTSYVFNPSGQVIDASGLLAVFDAEGPTGTPVKDAQRTKTHDATRTTIAIVWGTTALPGRTREATAWYRELVATIPGATNEDVTVLQVP